MKNAVWLFLCFFPALLQGQNVLTGRIQNAQEPVIAAHIRLLNTQAGAISDTAGLFKLSSAQALPWTLEISAIGYKKRIVTLNSLAFASLTLEKDVLGLEQIVVSADRSAVAQREAVVLVQKIDRKLLDNIQAADIGAGLSLLPGVRTENNCQSCGFMSVRLNGLPGAYSQVLINSRPVYSPLLAVYGLEQFPASMIDRIEVVRGGGSALFGGNAVAGTINLISREPLGNTAEVGMNYRSIGLQSNEWRYQGMASYVSEDNRHGFLLHGQLRRRGEFDANADGFSEITRLRQEAIGAQYHFRPNKSDHLQLHINHIREFRRGGNAFDLLPHESDITEQLEHRISHFMLQYDKLSSDYRHKWSAFLSATYTLRDSYYGGGGRIIAPGDSLTASDSLALNAYGSTSDLTMAGGLSYRYQYNEKQQWLLGTELVQQAVNDHIPGYKRLIDQKVLTHGSFLQWQFTHQKHQWLAGLRYDRIFLHGRYTMVDSQFQMQPQWSLLVPRLSWMYRANDHWRLRLAYALGYRVPQAFDEDLHLETIGGGARLPVFDNQLQQESAQNISGSIDFADYWQEKPFNLVLDVFFTRLDNPFVWTNTQKLAGGYAVIVKQNGPTAHVYGGSLEARMADGDRWLVQASLTLQRSRYREPLLVWEGEKQGSYYYISSLAMLRSPDVYGFVQANYRINRHWGLQFGWQYTGGMWVAHITDPASGFTALKYTNAFNDLSLRLRRDWFIGKKARLESTFSLENLLNSYQRDFDRGALRDASYVYGPAQPRSLGLAVRAYF